MKKKIKYLVLFGFIIAISLLNIAVVRSDIEWIIDFYRVTLTLLAARYMTDCVESFYVKASQSN